MPTRVTALARLCHRSGTLVTKAFHSCANTMAQTITIVFNLARRIKPDQGRCNASSNSVILAVNNLTEIANKIIPKNLRII